MVAVGRDAFLLKGEFVLHQPDSDVGSGDAVLWCLLRSASIFLRVGYPILESGNPLDAGLLILVPGFDVGAFGNPSPLFFRWRLLPVRLVMCDLHSTAAWHASPLRNPTHHLAVRRWVLRTHRNRAGFLGSRRGFYPSLLP
jgi:hypothetical protein